MAHISRLLNFGRDEKSEPQVMIHEEHHLNNENRQTHFQDHGAYLTNKPESVSRMGYRQ